MNPATIEDQVKAILLKLDGALADAVKADGGNKSAGTRVRNALSDTMKACKATRADIIAKRG